MPTSSTDDFLPRGRLLTVTDSVNNGDTKTSGWYAANGHSSVVGYFIAGTGEAAGNATLEIEQSIDKDEVDITNTVSPDPAGNAQPFEFDLVGEFVRVTFTANEDISNVRLITYRSTRVSQIQTSQL